MSAFRALLPPLLGLCLLAGCGAAGGANPNRARGVCQEFVSQRLKAPATAAFSGGDETPVEVSEGVAYPSHTVRGHVDAQNSLGATLRLPYTCHVRPLQDGRWELVSLDIRQP